MRNVSLKFCAFFKNIICSSYIFCGEDKIRYFQGRFDIKTGLIFCDSLTGYPGGKELCFRR
jgi:hypothetical protein